jgi:hypothetical protein
MKKLLLPVIAVCCLAPVAAFAGSSHPLITSDTETVAPSKFEAETAIEYSSNKIDSDFGSVKLTKFTLQETVIGGIIPELDAFITVPYISGTAKTDLGSESKSGLGDVTIGAKWKFMNVDKIALAVKPFVILPVGDEKKLLGKGGAGFGAALVASTKLDDQIAIDANLGLLHQSIKTTDDFTGDSKTDSYNEFDFSVAGKYEFSRELKGVGELAYSKTDQTGSKALAFLGAGAVYAALPNLDVDAGLRIGLTKETEDFIVLAGATYKF